MSAFVLGFLFLSVAVFAALSVIDSALRGRRAYRQLRIVALQTGTRQVRVRLSGMIEPVRLSAASTHCIIQARNRAIKAPDLRDQLRVAA